MDLNTFVKFLYESISTIPTNHREQLTKENIFFKDSSVNTFTEKFKFTDLRKNFEFILENYGKILYVKIINNQINSFIPVVNFFFNDRYIDGFLLEDFNTSKEYIWIKNLLELLCEKRLVSDCEFFVNYDREIPIIFNTKIKHLPVFSFNTNKFYKDIPFPTSIDFYRMTNFSLGIEDFKSMKWEDKETEILLKCDHVSEFYNKNTLINIEIQNRLSQINVPKKIFVNTALNYTYLENSKIIQIQDSEPNYDINEANNILPSNSKFIIIPDDIGHFRDFSTALFTGSCLIKLKSPWDPWFGKFLTPGVHYVEIERDLSNFENIIDWCFNHEEECKKMGMECRKFAVKYLCSNGILDFLQKQIIDLIPVEYNISREKIQCGQQIEYILKYSESFNNYSEITNKININNFNREILSWEYKHVLSAIAYKTEGVSEIHNFIEEYKFMDRLSGINSAFIGINSINKICREIPNFQYTIYMYAIPGDEPLYLYTEKIHNSVSLDSFLDKNSKKVYEIFIQLFLSLQLAYELFCFDHGNLSLENLRVKILDKPITIYYRLNSRTFILSTRYILVITDYSNSTVLSNFHFYYKSTRMFIGEKIKDKLDLNNLEDALHSSTEGNIKNIIKKIGTKTGKKFSIPETTKEPIGFMKNIIPKKVIEENNIKFGMVPQGKEPENKQEENIRLLYDKTINVPNPYEKAQERYFVNPIPVEETAIGNVILNYEISQSIKSILLDLNMNFNVNINLSEHFKQLVNIISVYYEKLIQKTINETFEENNADLYSIKILLRKYMSVIISHPLSKKLLKTIATILSSTIKDSISSGIKNTKQFYEIDNVK